MMRMRISMVIAILIPCVLLVSSPAFAGSVYQGRDVSYGINGSNSGDIRVCDREKDGHRAYTRFYKNDPPNNPYGPFILKDRRGANGACSSHYGNDRIFKHQTCEVRGGGVGGGDDRCSGYSQH